MYLYALFVVLVAFTVAADRSRRELALRMDIRFLHS